MVCIRPVAGFETLNYQFMTDLNTSTEATQTTEPAIAVEPVLATALSKKQKIELLEKSQMFEALTFKQIRALIWWGWFKPKKLNKFYGMLQIGKAARFAFEDVQHCH